MPKTVEYINVFSAHLGGLACHVFLSTLHIKSFFIVCVLVCAVQSASLLIFECEVIDSHGNNSHLSLVAAQTGMMQLKSDMLELANINAITVSLP